MSYTPCRDRIFPFRLDLFGLYEKNIQRLIRLSERLGPDSVLSAWENSLHKCGQDLTSNILDGAWQLIPQTRQEDPETRVDALFSSLPHQIPEEKARKLIGATPPIPQFRERFPDFLIEKELTAYQALHLRFDGLACLAEALIEHFCQQGALVIYDLLKEERIAAGQGTAGSVEEFIEDFTEIPDSPTLFTAGLEFEVIRRSNREVLAHVQECEWARYFQDCHPTVGYLIACSSDEAAYRAFNPSLRLLRTQTLMEGSEYCDFLIFAAAETF